MAQRAQGYGAVAKALHWLIFLLLAAQYAIGSIMPHIGRDTANEGWVSWHFSVGAAILFFVLVRLAWRLFNPVEPFSQLTAFERTGSLIIHWVLYVLILAMTVLGWAATNYRGWDVKLFGVIILPPLAAKGTPWAHQAGDVHNILVYVLLAAIALHVGAALYHQFIKQDRLISRMV